MQTVEKTTLNPNDVKPLVTSRYYGTVMLLKNHNVVHDEIITYSRFKSILIGLIWRYIPDLMFQHRRYMVVDNSRIRNLNKKNNMNKNNQAKQ